MGQITPKSAVNLDVKRPNTQAIRFVFQATLPLPNKAAPATLLSFDFNRLP